MGPSTELYRCGPRVEKGASKPRKRIKHRRLRVTNIKLVTAPWNSVRNDSLGMSSMDQSRKTVDTTNCLPLSVYGSSEHYTCSSNNKGEVYWVCH